jgi:hypothetical protein
MDLAAVLALTRAKGGAGAGKHEEETLASLERCASKALARQAGAMMALSPIARLAQTVTATTSPQEAVEVTEAAAPGPVATDSPPGAAGRGGLGQQSGGASDGEPSRSQHTGPAETTGCRGAGRQGSESPPGVPGVRGKQLSAGVSTYLEAIARPDRFDPETSAIGGARGGLRGTGAGDAALAHQMAQQDAAEQEELVVATSRDAELAMLMVPEETRERGIDWKVALRAQGGGSGQLIGQRRMQETTGARARTRSRTGVRRKWSRHWGGSASSARGLGEGHLT